MKLSIICLAGAVGCGSTTRLSPTSQRDLIAAERLVDAIIVRQDGGMPHADRVFAEGAFCLVDHVLVQANAPRDDAGVKCR